jgi:hypothetical protein
LYAQAGERGVQGLEEEHAISLWCGGVPQCGVWHAALHPNLCSPSHAVYATPAADLVITHALEWPSLTVQWLPVSARIIFDINTRLLSPSKPAL